MHLTKSAAAFVALLALAACDNGPSAVAKQEPVAEPAVAAARERQASADDRRAAPMPQNEGEPM